MRRIILVLLTALLSVAIYAQNFPDEAVMNQLAAQIGLTEEETGTLFQIYSKTEKEIRGADLELDVYRAQLARLLFPAEVNMREVEALLKQSYEWQLKRQLARIGRQVEIRKFLGEDRWVQYSRLMNNLRNGASNGAAQTEHREGAKPSGGGNSASGSQA